MGKHKAAMLTWDRKRSIGEALYDIEEALIEYDVGFSVVDTQSDEFAVVIGDKDMTDEEAEMMYEEEYGALDEDEDED